MTSFLGGCLHGTSLVWVHFLGFSAFDSDFGYVVLVKRN
jgi:hypothetical protein